MWQSQIGNRKSAIFLLLSVFCLLPSGFSQQPFNVPQIQTNDLQIVTKPVSAVTTVNTQVVGNPGPATYYYWVVADYPSGNAPPSPPAVASQVPSVLNGSNYVTIIWQQVPGATSYDVLKTNTPVLPSGPAQIALATAVTGSMVNDQGAALSNYSFNPASPQVVFEAKDDGTSYTGISQPALSLPGQGKIYYDKSSNTFYQSLNGGNYVPLSGSGSFAPGGDLSGTATNQTVIGIQGRSVLSTAPSSGQVLGWNGSAWAPTSSAGSGTVTSVGLSMPSIFSVGGSPITGAGTLSAGISVAGSDYVLTSTGANAAAWQQINSGASCGDGTHAINYNASTHLFGCQALTTGGAGTVTSVGLALPSIFTVSGSPVTLSGTLTGSLANENANTVFAGPASGAAAAPTFRALTAADLASSPVTNDCLGFNGTVLFWTSCGGSGVSSFTGDGALLSNSASVGAVTATLANAPAMSLWGNPTTASAAPGYTPNAGLWSLLIQPPSGQLPPASLRVFGDNGSDDIARFVTFGAKYGLKIDFAGEAWLGSVVAPLNTGQLNFGNGVSGGSWVTVQNNAATSPYNFNLPTTAGSSGQVLTSAGGGSAPMTWSSPLTNPMTTVGDVIIGGTSGAANRLALGTNGQCLQSNGTTVVYGACGSGSGLPSSWSIGTNNLVTAAPTSGQDQTTLNIQPSLASGGTFNIVQAAATGTAPQTGCTNGVYWAVTFGGSMCTSANSWIFGTINQQSTASYIGLYGAPGLGAYTEIFSAALPTPAQPVPTNSSTGGTIAAGTYDFKITYLAGPSQTYETAASTQGATTTTGSTSTLTVPAPTQVAGATGWNVYEFDSSQGSWSKMNSSPLTSFTAQTYTTLTGRTTATPPTVNMTGGLFQSYLGAATAMSGAMCVSSTAPGADCGAGTWIQTNPMTAAGDLVVGGTVNTEGFAAPGRLGIGSNGQCLTVSSGLPVWGSCGSGTFTAGGDLSGTSSSQTVIGLQTHAVSATAPTSNQVLEWNGTAWTPTALPGSISNVQITVGTTAIAANTCTSASTATMTGVATTSVFSFTPTADTAAVTGWGSTGGLVIDAWPTANTLNYKVCNQTAASITPSASVTFNVSAK